MSDSPAQPQDSAKKKSGGFRNSTFFFVLGFVVIVLVLLTAYRYSVDTRANDWYLYQVAKHTTWGLSLVGDEAKLENHRDDLGDPKRLRAEMQAWEDGRDTPTAEELVGASDAPLTAWEAWSYRAMKSRRELPGREYGPRVEFIQRKGLSSRVREQEMQLNRLRRDTEMDPQERQEAIDALLTIVQPMRDELNTTRRTQGPDPDPTYEFIFIVISECGAIEVMAIFFAAVIAFPTRWWKRFVGILIGVPIMYLVNILRLCCLAFIGAFSDEWFKFAHEYLWQAVYIIFVVIVWMLWVEYVVRAPEPEEKAEVAGPVEDGS